MPVAAAAALGCLALVALADLRGGRVPNALAVLALALALAAYPERAAFAGAALAPLPLLALALPRFVGMGDVKFAAPIGALVAGAVGPAAVPWWWAWSLLAASLTLTVALAAESRSRARGPAPALVAEVGNRPPAAAAPDLPPGAALHRRQRGAPRPAPPLAPALLAAALVVLATA